MTSRFYGVLLRLLPGRFRVRYGGEMRRMFEDHWSESGPWSRFALILRAVRDIAWTSVAVRFSSEDHMPLPEVERGRGQLAGWAIDVRIAWRGLRRRPGFAATAVVTVALGIGATTAVFSVVDATVLRGLGMPDEDRLVSVWSTFERQPGQDFLVSAAEFTDVRSDVRSFERVGAWYPGTILLEPTADGVARTVATAFTVADIYAITGARAELGRLPGGADDVLGAPRVALISHGLWMAAFGGDADVVRGRTLIVGSQPVEIIGVLAAEVTLPGQSADVWVHTVLDPASWATNRSGHGLAVIASLREGVPESEARAELAELERRWAERYAGQHSFGLDGHHTHAMMLGTRVLGSARKVAVLLSFASALLLILACANVANLLLARGEARRTEVGVRLALGASARRVARPVLLEGMTIGVCGGVIGLLLAGIGLPVLLRLAPGSLAGMDAAGIDARVVSFAIGISLLTGLVFTLAPAWAAARENPAVLLRAAGRGRTGSTRGLRILVAGQLALATVLLAGAALLTRSVLMLNAVDAGLDTSSRLALDLTLPVARYGDSTSITGFYHAVEQRLDALGTVRAVAVVRNLPLRDAHRFETLMREGDVDERDRVGVVVQAASAGYLATLGIPLLEGRDLSSDDRGGRTKVALVNRAAARSLWPGQSVIGKRVRALFTPESFGLITIVGVYDDVRSTSLTTEPAPEIILPIPQVAMFTGWVRNETLVLHTETSPAAAIAGVRAAIAEVDPSVAVESPTTMRDVLRAGTSRERFVAALVVIFSVLALTIAAVGVFGVVSFVVARQTREFAIRSSLGAGSGAIMHGVLRANAGVAGIGALAGAVIALLLAPMLRGFLFNVAPRDGVVLAAVPLALLAVALVASALPAVRAARIPPARILHDGD